MKSVRTVPSIAAMPGTISLQELATLNGVTRPVSVTDLLHRLWSNPTQPGEYVGSASGVEFHGTGAVWWLCLDNERTEQVVGALELAKEIIKPLCGPFWDWVETCLDSATGQIDAINKLGGANGVDINGVVGTIGYIVTPHVHGLYLELIRVARFAVSGRTILEFMLKAASQLPGFAQALNVGVAAEVYRLVKLGTPFGWAVAGAFGAAIDLLLPTPDPDEYGVVHADADVPGEWESFWMATSGDDRRVSLLSWVGFLSAKNAGGMGVYANRATVDDWETWKLIKNGDHTVSLQTHNGHFLCAEEGGGRECQADRTSIGDWEKFHLVFLPDGRVALKTKVGRQFVRVIKEED